MQQGTRAALELLPEELRRELERMEGTLDRAEEIRLRRGRQPSLLLPEGELCFGRGEPVSGRELEQVLDRASGCSLHAYAGQLRRGYINARNGVRIGLCGLGTGQDSCRGIRDISSLALRIPRQIKGIGAGAIESLRPFRCSVLAVAPPGGGKTSFLRELIRKAADSGRRVGVCDERGELAAQGPGGTGFDLGRCCDVLSGVSKAEGMIMLLRSMNPQIIAVDEISSEEDLEAIERAAGCGTAIFAAAHGRDLADMKKRELYARVLERGIFERAVVISGSGSQRSYRVEELC